jgi:membrane protease YdiL (CAAX protease family)
MPSSWWLFLVVGIPIIAYLSAALNGTINDPFPYSPWYQIFPVLVARFFLGPLEEFGWRGVAQPLLQRKMAPFWAGLVIGTVAALWHIPAFLLGGGVEYGSWSFVPFFGGVIAIYVILTPMFNSSSGSLLIAYLYHFQMMNPIFPDAQPWDNLLFGIAAVVIVILNRKTIFKKGSGVTEVLMPGETPGLEE